MPTVFVSEGEDPADVARELLELAGEGNASAVRVRAGEGQYGAYEVTDEIADGWQAGQGDRDKRARQKAADEEKAEAERRARQAESDDDAKVKPPTARERRAAAADADKTTKTNN